MPPPGVERLSDYDDGWALDGPSREPFLAATVLVTLLSFLVFRVGVFHAEGAQSEGG
jgi:hypothetical protein